MALPEDLTRNPDGSFVPLTWAEGGAVVEPSAGRKGTGWQAADVVTKEELNWLSQEPMRWLRAVAARFIESSDAFSYSWIVPNGAGVWSTNGVGVLEGFLSDDPVGVNSLVADIWADPDDVGGVRVQVSVPKAGPHVFPANRDTYVFVPIDVIAPPTVTEVELSYVDVPVGDPQPATPAGTVPAWRVETDGATIVDQEILLTQFPVLKQIGFQVVSAGIAMVAGDLDVGGALGVTGFADFFDAVTIAGLLTVNNAAIVTGNATLLTDNSNTLTANGNCALGLDSSSVNTVNGFTTLNHGLQVPASSPNTTEILTDVTLGDTGADTLTVSASSSFGSGMTLLTGLTFTLNGNAKISGGTTSRVETGLLALQIGAAAPAANGEIAASTDGTPAFRANGVGRFTFGGINGPWVGEDADQVPETGLAATTFVTTSSKTNVNGLLRIRVRGEMQRSVAGTNTISLQQDQGSSTWVDIDNGGVTTKPITTKDTSVAADWTSFQMERTFGAGATETFFRLSVSAGAGTAKIRDTHLTVRRLGA